MKEKIANLMEKGKEFVEENSGEIVVGVYTAFSIVILVISLNSIRLFNKKTKLEIKNLAMK